MIQTHLQMYAQVHTTQPTIVEWLPVCFLVTIKWMLRHSKVMVAYWPKRFKSQISMIFWSL